MYETQKSLHLLGCTSSPSSLSDGVKRATEMKLISKRNLEEIEDKDSLIESLEQEVNELTRERDERKQSLEKYQNLLKRRELEIAQLRAVKTK